MAVQEGEKVFVADQELFRTKDGRIVDGDHPDKLTKVAVPGQRMSMARAASLGLVSGEEGAMAATPVSDREDRITPMSPSVGKPADRTDRVRQLTPAAPATAAPADKAKAEGTKSMPAPEDKAVRKGGKTSTKRKGKGE